VAIGPEQVGEEVGIAGVILAAGGGGARSGGFHDIRVDWDDSEARLQESVDHEARRALEGDGQGGGSPDAAQALDELGQPGRGVGHHPAPADRARLVEHTDGMHGGRPIQADGVGHCAPPWDCETLHVERPPVAH
jgi:hypothetical protein